MKHQANVTISTAEEAKVFLLTTGEQEERILPVSAEKGKEGTVYRFEVEAGRYVARLEKSGFYSAERAVQAEGETALTLPLLPRALHGYEPHEDKMVFCHDPIAWDRMAPEEDERWEDSATVFSTSAFVREEEVGIHRITDQKELWDAVAALAEKNPHMHLFELFESGVYNLSAPIALFSKELPDKVGSLEEAGALLQKSEKPMIHYQAQIHGNETSPGEAALAMMAYLATPAGEALLEKINLYIIPRLNPEGGLLYDRRNGQGLDLNRDFFALRGRETRGSLRAYRIFKPCVMIDGHELRSRKAARIERYEDIQLSAGVAVNASTELYDRNLELLFHTVGELAKRGLRGFFYLDHVSGVGIETGTRICAERGAMTVLIEGRGISFGQERYRRRVYAQFTAAKSVLERIAAEPEAFKGASDRERASILAPFDREFVVEGAYTDSPETDPKFPITYFDMAKGEVDRVVEKPVTIYRVPVRSRVRPEAYVLPLGEEWETALTTVLDRHGIERKELPAGTALFLTRFIREGEKVLLSEEKERIFEKGALEIPVAQEAGRIVSFLFEADCVDSALGKTNLRIPALFAPEGDFAIYRKERK